MMKIIIIREPCNDWNIVIILVALFALFTLTLPVDIVSQENVLIKHSRTAQHNRSSITVDGTERAEKRTNPAQHVEKVREDKGENWCFARKVDLS